MNDRIIDDVFRSIWELADVVSVTISWQLDAGETCMMLVRIVRALLVSLLSAFVTVAAEAQQPASGPGALAVPHISAPASRISPLAPSHAPHLIAPRLPSPSVSRLPSGLVPRSGIKLQINSPQVAMPRHYYFIMPHTALTRDAVKNPYAPRTLRNPAFADLAARNSAVRSLVRSTFRGSFAESELAERRGRHSHHRPVVVLGFIGPLFWPYAYNDLIDFTFRPYAYDTFWPRAYNDVLTGIYGGYAAPKYFVPEYSVLAESGMCASEAQHSVDFPVEQIARQIKPDQQQQTLLDDLKTAAAQAMSILQNACPTGLPSTPPGRIAAMRIRVEAMLQAIKVVRPALEAFYHSLTDEQKERFNAVDQGSQTQRLEAGGLCAGRWRQNVAPPVEQVERTLHLSSDQESFFKGAIEASAKAGDMLRANCQPEQAMTPTGRVAEMEDRLNAILSAVETLQAPLNTFYQSLSEEQKARFNRLGAI